MSTGSDRRPLVSGNWKMHHDHIEAIRTVEALGLRMREGRVEDVDVSVHPPFTDLRSVQTVLADRSLALLLGAQSCHWEDQGAFTGEVSARMLARLDVKLVIVGHSERRLHCGESDEVVARKLGAVLRHAMTPILCVGETADERAAGLTEQRLVEQVERAFGGVAPAALATCVVAYEPIWAIGVGAAATPEDAAAASEVVRSVVSKLAGKSAAEALRVLYGGSVDPENTASLVGADGVDGVLVGGASLDPEKFYRIVEGARALR